VPDAANAAPETELRDRARKLRPQYGEGPLVRVARARHQAEAELIQGLLAEAGVASMAKRSGGFDVPDFLFSGPRDVYVAASGADTAREMLNTDAPPAGFAPARPWVQAMAVALAVLLLAATAAGVVAAIL